MIGDNYVPVRIQGDNSTVEFSFNFPIIAEENLKVYSEDVDTGVQTLITTGITIEFDDSVPAGTVTFDEAPTDEEYVIIGREISPTQTVDYKTSSGFQGSVVMRSFDKITAIIQNALEAITRSVKLPLGSSLSVVIPEPEDNKALVWDGVSGAMKNSTVDVGAIDEAVDACEEAKDAAQLAQAAAEEAASTTLTMAQILAAMMPVGFVVTLGVATNPATLYGFGTWTQIKGRVIVGIDDSQIEFDTLDETGGAKTVTLDATMIPAHSHDLEVMTAESGGTARTWGWSNSSRTVGMTSGRIGNTGGGLAHENMPPYIVKYVWERVS